MKNRTLGVGVTAFAMVIVGASYVIHIQRQSTDTPNKSLDAPKRSLDTPKRSLSGSLLEGSSAPHRTTPEQAEVIAKPLPVQSAQRSTNATRDPPQGSEDEFLLNFFSSDYLQGINAKDSFESTEGTPDYFNHVMASETRDESWAPGIEIGLSDYLARQLHANVLYPPSVECRATVCRILTAVDVATLRVMPQFGIEQAMLNLQHESLSNEFDASASMLMTNDEHPDKVGYAYFLRRTPRSRPRDP